MESGAPKIWYTDFLFADFQNAIQDMLGTSFRLVYYYNFTLLLLRLLLLLLMFISFILYFISN